MTTGLNRFLALAALVVLSSSMVSCGDDKELPGERHLTSGADHSTTEGAGPSVAGDTNETETHP